MTGTNCGPNFIGPQGIIHVIAQPTCGPNFVKQFVQPYQVPPPPPISKGAHFPIVAPSFAHVPKQRMPIMSQLSAFVVIRNETSTRPP
jgi:hypothetical protein